jgi:Asp/Glu/hydantoin racemase
LHRHRAPGKARRIAAGRRGHKATILVINPNSNPAVTAGLHRALDPFRLPGGPEIRCVQLEGGPFGIESEADVAAVAPLLVERVRSEPAAAFVIACYSDPGLAACREATSAPVFGIQESTVLTALSRADRFGVVAILARSIERHRRALRQMGVLDRLAGERALELRVHELAEEARTWERLVTVCRALVREDGAGTVILGCAGMAGYRARLEAELGVLVIDPTQAAVGLALTTLLAAAS